MLAVAPGDAVKKGQVLARLSSTQALELQRDALQAGSQAALLQQNLKRDEQLFAEGLIAESRLQATRAAATQANALAGERRQGLALAGATTGKVGGFLALTATIDGVVLEQSAQLGQRVEAATPIYHIAQLSPLWLEIQAPVDFAATLKIGTAVKVADSGASGSLIGIGRAVDAASQTVLLRAEVSGGAESLRPGQVVAVEIAGGAQRGQTLPASAVIRNEGQPLVFVQLGGGDPARRFEARPVQVISQSGELVVVRRRHGWRTSRQPRRFRPQGDPDRHRRRRMPGCTDPLFADPAPAGAGAHRAAHRRRCAGFLGLPIDAYPDVSTTQVKIILKAPGMTPEEVETRLAVPVEQELLGIPHQRLLRSTSKYALTDITIDFADGTDIYRARQQVGERLASAMGNLPAGVSGGMAPITTPLGEMFMFTLEGDLSLADKRALLDWVIRPQLRTIPGVADVATAWVAKCVPSR